MGGSQSREVLIVEDEWLVRMELVDAFEALGFSVLESPTAEQALELLYAAPDLSLLVTDIRLAEAMDGWQLAQAARTAKPDLPVIYLSANPPSPDLIVDGGVFIEKPALMERVTSVALHLLGKGT